MESSPLLQIQGHPDTIKEEAREQIMNSPEGKTYTAKEVQEIIEEKMKQADEAMKDMAETISELEKEVGNVFDQDVARRHRVERIGNHLVMGLGSDIPEISLGSMQKRSSSTQRHAGSSGPTVNGY